MKYTYENFARALTETGRYETPPSRLRRPLAKPGFWTTLRYVLCILRISYGCAVKHLFGRFNFDVWSRATWRSLTLPERMGARVEIAGFENRSAHAGPVVYVCNHMSTLETMALPPILNPFGHIAVILKESLAKMPLIGPAICHVGAIAVSRRNPREDLRTVLEEGGRRIADGMSVLLFPQGTRSDEFNVHKFSSLGTKLAERAGVPVVPIACQSNFLGRGKAGLLKDFGAVDPSRPLRFLCGPALDPKVLGAKETQERAISFIAQTLESWGLPVVR